MVWHEPIIRVAQPCTHGCAIAAAAMVADVRYSDALKAVFPSSAVPKYPQASSRELLRGLRRLGMRCHLSSRFGAAERRHRVIIGFDWVERNPGQGHYVVWDPVEQRFLDPGYDRALRYDIYLRGFRRAQGDYLAVVVEGRTSRWQAPPPRRRPINITFSNFGGLFARDVVRFNHHRAA